MSIDLREIHRPMTSVGLRRNPRQRRLVRATAVGITLVIGLSVVASAQAGYTDVVGKLSPVAWWRLGEASGTIAADAADGHDGDYMGDPGLGQPGGVVGDADFAVSFDELDDYVEVPDFAYGDDMGQFSLAFLFSTDPGDNGFRYAVSHGNIREVDSFNVWFCEGNSCDDLFDDVPGAGAGNLRVNVTNVSDNEPFVDVGVEFADEQWHLFTMTVSGNQGLTVYVDGEAVAGDPNFITDEPFNPDGDLNIGSRSDGNLDRYFYGDLDEVMLFSYPLSEAQVAKLAAARLDTGSQLQAGDADQDLDFDQLDLVRVQVAAKYLTGQPATWGEGDWDGAPGGEPGNPPTGDGVFDQKDIIAALSAGKYLTGPYAAISAGGATRGGDAFLAAGDLPVVGSPQGHADPGAIDLVYVPEPASWVLLVVGLLILTRRTIARR